MPLIFYIAALFFSAISFSHEISCDQVLTSIENLSSTIHQYFANLKIVNNHIDDIATHSVQSDVQKVLEKAKSFYTSLDTDLWAIDQSLQAVKSAHDSNPYDMSCSWPSIFHEIQSLNDLFQQGTDDLENFLAHFDLEVALSESQSVNSLQTEIEIGIQVFSDFINALDQVPFLPYPKNLTYALREIDFIRQSVYSSLQSIFACPLYCQHAEPQPWTKGEMPALQHLSTAHFAEDLCCSQTAGLVSNLARLIVWLSNFIRQAPLESWIQNQYSDQIIVPSFSKDISECISAMNAVHYDFCKVNQTETSLLNITESIFSFIQILTDFANNHGYPIELIEKFSFKEKRFRCDSIPNILQNLCNAVIDITQATRNNCLIQSQHLPLNQIWLNNLQAIIADLSLIDLSQIKQNFCQNCPDFSLSLLIQSLTSWHQALNDLNQTLQHPTCCLEITMSIQQISQGLCALLNLLPNGLNYLLEEDISDPIHIKNFLNNVNDAFKQMTSTLRILPEGQCCIFQYLKNSINQIKQIIFDFFKRANVPFTGADTPVHPCQYFSSLNDLAAKMQESQDSILSFSQNLVDKNSQKIGQISYQFFEIISVLKDGLDTLEELYFLLDSHPPCSACDDKETLSALKRICYQLAMGIYTLSFWTNPQIQDLQFNLDLADDQQSWEKALTLKNTNGTALIDKHNQFINIIPYFQAAEKCVDQSSQYLDKIHKAFGS